MAFTLKFHDQEKSFDKKVALLDLVDDPKKEFVCAKVNNRIRELTYEVYYDADVEFLTVRDADAIPIYETSLRYLVAMAFKRAYPELEVRFSYNVSRSIFVQILNDSRHSDMSMVRRIEDEMRTIVAADFPLNRMIVTKEEAKNIYEDKKFTDKLELLKYRPEKTVHLYDCDGYLNYMYGRMVPSTGYLKKYKIRLYSPGIIIQYPRAEAGGDIPKFEDAPTFGKTLKASHAWGKIAGADSVSGINEHIKKDGVIDFINMCETRHNRMLVELGNMIESDIDTIRLICIAGPSSSGKTTFSNRLRIELLSRGIKPIRLSIDDYYLPKSEVPKDENGDPDLESINALDIELFNQNMLDLISGKEVQLPRFDFKLGHRVSGRKLKVSFSQPIIIEGIHALNDMLTINIPKHQKFKIYISPQAQINFDNHNPMSLTDLRLLRRIVRDKKYRNASAEETMSMWPSVRKGEFTWIYNTQEGADFVFNSLLSYELSVMKKYAMPLLNNIDTNSVYFPVAERLIRMLKYFDDMPDEWVPSNSLLREFIGGSCYANVDV
ncbi:MAG TPA: nucleoside kinase [Bacilli bacterium]|nr:nucleoside kinase [Bacilli bacterium]HPV70060.1 nucleoside kinase [Bacilli bacterium]HPY37985.1 nucleoside kinase [Bacilli bacterium]HQC32599.1 nucleoside kinase [Bacilli bacterium]